MYRVVKRDVDCRIIAVGDLVEIVRPDDLTEEEWCRNDPQEARAFLQDHSDQTLVRASCAIQVISRDCLKEVGE